MLRTIIVGIGLVSATVLADPDIDTCLKAWRKHPFGKNPSFKALKTNVKVFGIGGNIKDLEVTKSPQLVLVKHGVSVMSKQTFELMNPKGWYCLKGPVTVMAKSVIKTHCKSHLAYGDEGATIAASNDGNAEGVTVLGKIQVERVCD